ncbi:hypothetical protein CONLIGDRAFT_633460 [Coniochaeta ligniaria NRRL 30616]|uniref:Zn(2)-C6 fungal-type domain-containing protein n=1 Tax=Coniochaeta ligniaria NRRL 30616 TaxID=1408157 RepID=A0A1J7JJ57_9PEZI|nr:hypothetical protein CONLIGDRAFT_633460 [Coniochaeta ligniaria NRRL 30616]
MPTNRPRRLLRNSKACDFCHKRRIKCQSDPLNPARCQNCTDFDIACTFTRPSKRARSSPTARAPAPQTASLVQAALPPSNDTEETGPLPASHREPRLNHGRGELNDAGTSVVDNRWTQPLSPAWQRFARASTPVVKKLLSVYQEIVHPIFPFFDSVRLEQRIGMLEHVHNRAFFSSVMAACAISSARLRDGAIRSSIFDGQELPEVLPETYYSAAEDALPEDLLHCQDFDHLRGYALLAIASIQDAQIPAMQKYVGQYFTILAVNQWHDESSWTQGLSSGEIEERRRVFWSIYTLDIYSAVVWDGCIHFQEGHAKVRYPSADNVERGEPVNGVDWIVGWNFTTDLYRILEHELSRLRSRSSKFAILGHPTSTRGASSVSSQDFVNDLYAALPSVFKQLQPVTGDPARDIYSFQAANIQATMALLRMVYLTLDEDADLERKCSVVSDVLSTFHQVPKPYLRAISAPLVYHIRGIGTILGSVMEGPLSPSSCLRVRDLLLSMATLLDSLEAFLHRSAGAGQNLRELVSRMEEYMNSREIRPNPAEADPERLSNEVAAESSNTWDDVALNDLSPQFQLPEELLQDWTWPFTMPNNYLSFQPL